VGASFNDIGFLARVRDGRPGVRVTLGGGLSTLRRTGILAHEFAPAEEVVEICEAVVRVFNRTGDRQHRHRARLKFVVEKLGAEEFLRQYQEERQSVPRKAVVLHPPPPRRPVPAPRRRPPEPGFEEFALTNVRPQRDPELAAVTIRLPLGDLTAAQFRALADVAEEFSAERELRTTVEQNALLRFVGRSHLSSLHAALAAAGLARPRALSISDVVSCPGAYSCRLAVTQSRGMADALTTALADRREVLPIKISGCPNGCGQHYVAGIGLQGSVRKVEGRAVPQYHVYVGGHLGAEEATFGRLVAKVPARKVPEAVRRLADLAAREAVPGETAGQVLARLAADRISALLADLEPLEHPAPEDFVDLGEQKAFEVQTSEGECAA
jgi:sulfite reductase beta subunit-like hemoprotein